VPLKSAGRQELLNEPLLTPAHHQPPVNTRCYIIKKSLLILLPLPPPQSEIINTKDESTLMKHCVLQEPKPIINFGSEGQRSRSNTPTFYSVYMTKFIGHLLELHCNQKAINFLSQRKVPVKRHQNLINSTWHHNTYFYGTTSISDQWFSSYCRDSHTNVQD